MYRAVVSAEDGAIPVDALSSTEGGAFDPPPRRDFRAFDSYQSVSEQMFLPARSAGGSDKVFKSGQALENRTNYSPVPIENLSPKRAPSRLKHRRSSPAI